MKRGLNPQGIGPERRNVTAADLPDWYDVPSHRSTATIGIGQIGNVGGTLYYNPDGSPVAVGGSAANAVQYTAQTLTDAQREQARQNVGVFTGYDTSTVGFLFKGGTLNAGITNVARAANVSTLTLSDSSGMLVGQKFSIQNCSDTSFNGGSFVVATRTNIGAGSIVTFAQSASDVAEKPVAAGQLVSYEVTNDATHKSLGNPRLSLISDAAYPFGYVRIAWDNPAGRDWKLVNISVINYNVAGPYTVRLEVKASGLGQCDFMIRQEGSLHGSAYWNGTTAGGGVTSQANWVVHGAGGIAKLESGNRLYFTTIGTPAIATTAGPAQYAGPNILPWLPAFPQSPDLIADSVSRPATGGCYFKLINPTTGAEYNQAAMEAVSPASKLGFSWNRHFSGIINDHSVAPGFLAWVGVTLRAAT